MPAPPCTAAAWSSLVAYCSLWRAWKAVRRQVGGWVCHGPHLRHRPLEARLHQPHAARALQQRLQDGRRDAPPPPARPRLPLVLVDAGLNVRHVGARQPCSWATRALQATGGGCGMVTDNKGWAPRPGLQRKAHATSRAAGRPGRTLSLLRASSSACCREGQEGSCSAGPSREVSQAGGSSSCHRPWGNGGSRNTPAATQQAPRSKTA